MQLKIKSLYEPGSKCDYISNQSLHEKNENWKEINFTCPFFVLEGPKFGGEPYSVEYKVLLTDGYLGYLQIYTDLPDYFYKLIL